MIEVTGIISILLLDVHPFTLQSQVFMDQANCNQYFLNQHYQILHYHQFLPLHPCEFTDLQVQSDPSLPNATLVNC